MIIDCISDLHGHYPQLEGGDLLIVAGDLTARDTDDQVFEFFKWLHDQPYNRKIVVAGNHDNILEIQKDELMELHSQKSGLTNIEYLCDSGTEFEGLKIWGSPWTLKFPGMNPHCMAFTCETEDELQSHFRNIPDNIDILITHSAPFGILDKCCDGKLAGSKSLRDNIFSISPKISIFGHIHENGGKEKNVILGNDQDSKWIKFINASYVNERYQPVNKPVRVIL